MKRLFISMGLFLWLAIGGIVIVGAESYPVYLNGDRNYILCDAYKETAWYLDRSSLNVQKYDPPQYIIAVNVVTVPDADRGGTDISLPVGELSFALAYNMKFYDSYDDAFYGRI